MGQCRQVGLVQRHRVLLQAGEVVERELDGRGPQHPLPLVLLEPEFEGGDDLGFDLVAAGLPARDGHADESGGQPGQLVLERADLPPAVEAADPLHEGGQAALDLDHRRALPQGFGVQV